MTDDRTGDSAGVSRRTVLSATSGLAGAVLGEAQAATPPTNQLPLVDRAFVRIREGLVHYRHIEPATKTKALPLYLHHANPGSSRGYESLMSQLVRGRRCIAPDTLGYGDSPAPEGDQPEIPYFADSVVRILDALKIDKVDYYGAHTGAHVGTELALRHPDRVRRVIFDGVTVRTPEIRAWLLANYAPQIVPDDHGGQLHWAWLFVRDMSQYFPWFARDRDHRTGNNIPSAQQLHNSSVEVLKSLSTYHLVYRAVYRHDIGARLPLLKHPVMCLAKESDPNVVELDNAASKIPGVKKVRIARGAAVVEETARIVEEFLNA